MEENTNINREEFPAIKRKSFGDAIRESLVKLAEMMQFFVRFFKEAFKRPFEFGEMFNQAFNVAFKSMFPVSITAFVMGIVIVLQSRPALIEFGAGAYIPSMSAVSIIREIAPLITALICAGNVGSNICAELGSMKVTEQIDAMEVSGANPFKYLVVTRIMATTLIIPVLVVYADFISLFGSFTGANIKGEISITLFFNQVIDKLTFNDIVPSVIKSVFFGFTIGMISCFEGFTSNNGTEGVGRATNRSVVTSLLLVIIIDMVIVQVSSIFHII